MSQDHSSPECANNENRLNDEKEDTQVFSRLLRVFPQVNQIEVGTQEHQDEHVVGRSLEILPTLTPIALYLGIHPVRSLLLVVDLKKDKKELAIESYQSCLGGQNGISDQI